MKPVIAIPPESVTLASRFDGHGSFCGVSYSRAVEMAGGIPLIVPLTNDRKLLDFFLQHCNGLLLIGGGDVNPSRYGRRLRATERKTLWGVDDVRDEMEIYLCRQASKRDLPVLGICRGIQVMNVAFGGTLLPDISGHRNSKPDALAHEIEWIRIGKLKRALAACDTVNTSHHQAVDRIARGFQAVARAHDGIIEAMERSDARFFCAVQFHPERLVNVAPAFRKLFREFVKACRPR
jgi:putative glutamine amidotransferase